MTTITWPFKRLTVERFKALAGDELGAVEIRMLDEIEEIERTRPARAGQPRRQSATVLAFVPRQRGAGGRP